MSANRITVTIDVTIAIAKSQIPRRQPSFIPVDQSSDMPRRIPISKEVDGANLSRSFIETSVDLNRNRARYNPYAKAMLERYLSDVDRDYVRSLIASIADSFSSER